MPAILRMQSPTVPGKRSYIFSLSDAFGLGDIEKFDCGCKKSIEVVEVSVMTCVFQFHLAYVRYCALHDVNLMSGHRFVLRAPEEQHGHVDCRDPIIHIKIDRSHERLLHRTGKRSIVDRKSTR